MHDPERLPRWFAPVSGDLRVGGRYQVEGNAHASAEWAGRAVDAGDELAAAQEASRRTIAFYTTDPSEAVERGKRARRSSTPTAAPATSTGS